MMLWMAVFLKVLLGLKNKDIPCGNKQSYKQQKAKEIPPIPTPTPPHSHPNRPTIPTCN